MDFMNYQKMFPSPQQIQQQMQQQQRNNGFPTMNTWTPQFQSQQQQQPMFNVPFAPMNFGNQSYNNHFQGGHRQHHQQQFHHQRKNKNFQLPPPPLPTIQFGQAAMMQPPLSISPNGSNKDETPREIFFKTLSTSLKEANKVYCGKQTTWKNPLIYKTHLCDNYSNRQYCRFGVNCWYAHGPHELRCIPESDDLPDQAFITQYLSFLGLPKQTLDQIIQNAYYVANLSSEKSWFKNSTDFPALNTNFSRSKSLPCSPNKNVPDFIHAPTIPADPINSNNFCASYLSNGGGWDEIQTALNEFVDGEIKEGNDEKTFGNSFRLFGESFDFRKPL